MLVYFRRLVGLANRTARESKTQIPGLLPHTHRKTTSTRAWARARDLRTTGRGSFRPSPPRHRTPSNSFKRVANRPGQGGAPPPPSSTKKRQQPAGYHTGDKITHTPGRISELLLLGIGEVAKTPPRSAFRENDLNEIFFKIPPFLLCMAFSS